MTPHVEHSTSSSPTHSKFFHVIKRNGEKENWDIDQITSRLRALNEAPFKKLEVDVEAVIQRVVASLTPGIRTSELDHIAADVSAQLLFEHQDYDVFAVRILVSDLHKMTPKTFAEAVEKMYAITSAENRPAPQVSPSLLELVRQNAELIESKLVPERDFDFTYFGLKTLMRSYLTKDNKSGLFLETPQYMYMRVALGIWGEDLDRVFTTYTLLSQHFYTHATPTLFNAGRIKNTLASCFLTTMKDDSIEGIYDTVKEAAMISRGAGGIGLAVSNIRARGSYIAGSGGRSNGLVPMLRVMNETMRYVDQGGGKRNGSAAIYIEPWHADIFEFLEALRKDGNPRTNLPDLFAGLFVNDLFMERVGDNASWSLFDPADVPELQQAYGKKFDELYIEAEKQGKARKVVPAQDLLECIVTTLPFAGYPYICFKDIANIKSNQRHYGTILSSNLCTEIMQVSTPDETAVCNLASIALPKFVDRKSKTFDFTKMMSVVRHVVRSMDQLIDISSYPTESARKSNMLHRPMGIGVQGLVDVFFMLGMAYDSKEALELDRDIFEAIYFAALQESCQLAQEKGTYPTFAGSPFSQGKLQFDLWEEVGDEVSFSSRFDWDALKKDIVQYGTRNSLLTTVMPTASTSQILGNSECVDSLISNFTTRGTLSGSFQVVNKYLVEDLMALQIWNKSVRQKIILNKGSVQGIKEIPKHIQDIYKTAFEIKQEITLDHFAIRAPFIDQSQSTNMYLQDPIPNRIADLLFYAWRKGLKTGLYYLRTRPPQDGLLVERGLQGTQQNISDEEKLQCSLENKEACLYCTA